MTQASLRLAGTFWALDVELAHARHFPAVGWTQSYSLYAESLAAWYAENVGDDWTARRADALALLGRERELLEIVQLVGADALPDEDRLVLAAAALVREVFLQQHAFDPVDGWRAPAHQLAMLRAVLAARDGMLLAHEQGVPVEAILAAPALGELRRAKSWSGADAGDRLVDLAARLRRMAGDDTPPVPAGATPPGATTGAGRTEGGEP